VTSDWIADDDRLFEALRASLESTGAVPPDVVAAAKEVFGLRYVDEELARLTYDSQADAELVGAFRSGTLSLRRLVFGLGEITLDIDVLPDSVVGQVLPAQPGVVVAETREGPAGDGSIDDSGMFSVLLTLHGEVRFRVEPTGCRAFVTEWTRI
jgi:hypothetical protein